MAWLEKRPGRNKYYVCWLEITVDPVTGEKRKKKIRRSAKTENQEEAQASCDAINAVLAGQRVEAVTRKLIEEATEAPVPRLMKPVADLWKFFLAQPQPREVSRRTLDSKRTHIEQWVKWMGQRHPEIKFLNEVTEQMAAEYMATLVGKSGVTRNNTLSSLRSVFAIVRVPAGLGKNVWEAIPRVEARSNSKKSFTLDQVKKIWKESFKLQSIQPGFWPVALPIGFHCGLRLGDVCTLSWDEIDFEKGVLKLTPNKTSRSGRTVAFPLHSDFALLLREIGPKDEGYVWPEVAEAYLKKDKRITNEFAKLCSEVGIVTNRKVDGRTVVDYGFHSLRHTFRTLGGEYGAAPADLQKAAGWSNPAMAEHYNHSLEAGKRVAEKLPSLKKKS